MYKMDRVISFHISKEERDAVEVLRKYNINISRFLRRSLRNLAKKMCWEDEQIAKNKELDE